uniref:disease resistance protein At4g27190-like isoform X2 n=1 Tax=Fragaria vesca subsp. vesca TaxID=101020 RepID=UPI0005CA2F27|nr:PREDICTED: disease resistance protein At4g27190-like isoform X2 [Fragaria vesca subsp. vesca]
MKCRLKTSTLSLSWATVIMGCYIPQCQLHALKEMEETAITEGAVPVAKWTIKKLWQELGYMFCYKSNIGDLNEQVQQLRHKKDGIELEEKGARENSMIIGGQVIDWLVKADEQIKEKETTFSEKTVAARAACCNGWLPNMKGRFSLGRNAKKMTENVKDLLGSEPRTIAHPAPHAKVEFRPTEDSTQLGTNFHEGASSSGTSNHDQPPAFERKNIYFDSRKSTIRNVMEALRGNQINPIIICGLGGMGKTTLMGQVLEKAKEEGLFDEYTKATVKDSLNKAADVIQIQAELAEYLGTKLLEDVKESDPRASKLRQRLSQGNKKILVMLDNVWTTTPDMLWDIGIPPSCQLLVTSRQQDVFKDMDRRQIFPIHGLRDPDAWRLFKERAGSCIESDPEVHVVADMILQKCGGLPIAISTVGTALKDASIEIWNDALVQLENACPDNIDGVIDHVYGPITFSYERLQGEEAKSCFLLCCMFGGSADIRIEDLVMYGLGLELFNFKGTDSMVKGRNRVKSLVQTLKSRFLLLESDKKECVRMHDVVRDVALHIASEEFVQKKNDGVEKRIVVRDKAATVKLMDWPISEQSAICRSLFIGGRFVLLQYISEVDPPHTIFNRMEHLKVLAVGSCPSLQLSSLAVLRDIQTLRLVDCSVEDVSVIGELSTLMILSLRDCSNIEQLPDTFKNLSRLRLLDLSGCRELKIISPGVIKSLFRLEELYMWDSFQDWVVDKLASPETANWISQLEAEGRARRFRSWVLKTLDTWKSLNRSAVEQPADVGKLFRQEIGRVRVQEESTRWANSMDWNTGILAELLSLSRLTTLEAVLPPVNILLTSPLFNNLERFKITIGWEEHIRARDSEKYGVDDNYLRVGNLDPSAIVGSGITPFLKKTSIIEFRRTNSTEPQLMNVLGTVCFAKIRSLALTSCEDVEYLIDTTTTPNSSSSSAIFPLLNALEISNAISLNEIFHGELPTGSLKELRSLRFFLLPELAYIWKTNRKSELGVLKNILGHVQVLDVGHCSSLEGIISFESDDEEVINFQSLTELSLSKLPCFIRISRKISKGPERLIKQPLFDTKVHFPVLTKLRLGNMNFKEIWNNQLSAESFCELKYLHVTACKKLLHLVPTHMQNRMQKLERIHAWSCSSLEEIFEFRRLIVDDEGDATALTIFESGNQGTRINKMMSFKESRQAFQNLREIVIKRCDSLRTLLSPSVARGLVKLQTLTIENCKRIEEVVAVPAEGEETEDDNMFPQLQTLELEDLPNLGSFSQGIYNFKWPLVRAIIILRCNNMNKFCLGTLSTRKKVEIFVKGAGESVLQQLNNSRKEI